MFVYSSLESIRLKNFQSIRDEVELPIRPITFLYGPNSAGKSSIMDALVCLRDWMVSPKAGFLRSIRQEGMNSLQDEMVVGATFKLDEFESRYFMDDLYELALALPVIFVSDGGQGPPEWWPSNPGLLEIRVTTSRSLPENGISKLELFIDGKLVFNCRRLGPDINDYNVLITPVLLGKRICNHLCELAPSLKIDDSSNFLISVELSHGPLRFWRRYSDESFGEVEAVLLSLCDLLVGMAARCLAQIEGTVAAADRGLIRDDELTVVQPLADSSIRTLYAHWDDYGGVKAPTPAQLAISALSPFGGRDVGSIALRSLVLQANPHPAISAMAASYLQAVQEKNPSRALVFAATAWERQGAPSLEPLLHRPSLEPLLHHFVNRCLSDHLFIDQGYQIAVEVLNLSRTDLGAPIKGMTRKSRNKPTEDGVVGLVVICFLVDKAGRRLAFEDVGTGISCVVPVLCKLHGKFSFCQQPELHLHPALQSALGDVLVECAQTLSTRHIVETHSEYLLLRCLRRIRETTQGNRLTERGMQLSTDQVSVLYFDPQPDGATKVREIRISADGDFIDHWPRGFFQERGKDLFDE